MTTDDDFRRLQLRCASATRGWSEQITLTSTPSGAGAIVTGSETATVCTTPCVVQVQRFEDIQSQLNEGYERYVVPLVKELVATGAAGFAGNLLLGAGTPPDRPRTCSA